MKNFVLVLSFHLVLFMGGCGKVESETTSEEALSELEGEWITNCYQVSTLYVVRKATISGDSVRLLSEFHTDENCSSITTLTRRTTPLKWEAKLFFRMEVPRGDTPSICRASKSLLKVQRLFQS